MSGSSLWQGIKSGLGRSRAAEIGLQEGLSRPWVLVSTILATAVDVVMTPLAYLAAWTESTLGWVADLVLAPIGLVLALPYLGRSVAWLLAVVQTLAWAMVALPDGVLAWVGILPEKRLRVCVLLPPEANAQTKSNVLQALQVAAQIYQREANVRLIPATPWFIQGAFAGRVDPSGGWLDLVDPDTQGLAVGCAFQAAKEDLGRMGGWFAWRALRHHPFGIARRLLGIGAPVVIFAVGSVDRGRLAGCSLGPLTDYVTVQIDQPVCLAHELGHAGNLLHVPMPENLMNPTCGGAHLERWQVVLIRLSRHVSYL